MTLWNQGISAAACGRFWASNSRAGRARIVSHGSRAKLQSRETSGWLFDRSLEGPFPDTHYSRGIGQQPPGAKILQTDPQGQWVIFEDAAGMRKIQFDVHAAENVAPKPLPPRGPGKIDTPQTEATVGPDGKVYVSKGMHRLEAAQKGATIPPDKGGIPAFFPVGLNTN
jgi:hypothetical protein